MLALWKLWCWAFGHAENSETITEYVFSHEKLRTVAVDHTSLTCNRCGSWLA